MNKAKELSKVIKKAKKHGWFLHRRSKHDIYKHKKGGCVTVSRTDSERRSWREVEQYFKHQELLYHNINKER